LGYSVVHVDEIEGSGPGGPVKFVRRALGVERQPVAGADGFAMVAIGAPRGSYEPRGPF
jgi:hypothetical protein